MNPTFRRILWPGVMTLAMLVVLIGLGTWQIYRLHWKERILAQIAQAEASPPVPFAIGASPFTKVTVTGQLLDDEAVQYGAEVRDTPSGPQLGSHLIVPLIRDGSPTILVDRGWVPQTRRAPIDQPEGTVTIVGYVHPPAKPGWFSATDNVATRHFFTLDPEAISAALGLSHVAPLVLIALAPQPVTHAAGAPWPDPATHLPRPPNNHLSYVITWYGLAIALAVIFIAWARKVPKA